MIFRVGWRRRSIHCTKDVVDERQQDGLRGGDDVLGNSQCLPGVRDQGIVVDCLDNLGGDLEDQGLLVLLPEGKEDEQLPEKCLARIHSQEHAAARLLQVLSSSCRLESRIVEDARLDNHMQGLDLLGVENVGNLGEKAVHGALAIRVGIIHITILDHAVDGTMGNIFVSAVADRCSCGGRAKRLVMLARSAGVCSGFQQDSHARICSLLRKIHGWHGDNPLVVILVPSF